MVEGAPVLSRDPITGKASFLHRVHTNTLGDACLCDSYTVIILDG